MPAINELTETIRISQALQVMLLREEGKTLQEACKEVGISPFRFRFWAKRAPEAIDALREFVGEQQRLQLVELLSAWQLGIQAVAEDVSSAHLKLKDRVAGLKFLKPILEELLAQYHAQPGAEEAAHAFLKEGPKLQRVPSRMASVEVEPTEEGGVKVHVSRYHEILDLTPKDLEDPK